MEVYTKEIGKIIKETVKAKKNIQMEMYTREIIKIALNKAMECIITKMEKNI